MKEILLGEGKGTFNFWVEGDACALDLDEGEMEDVEGKIICLKYSYPGIYPLIRKCKGIISEYGGLSSHMAIISMEAGIPAIVGVAGILEKIQRGKRIRMISDNSRGMIYEIQ